MLRLRVIRWPLKHSATLALGVLLLTCAALAATDITRDLQKQNELRQSEFRKSELALRAELELGHAVQSFKDCLLRDDAGDCDGFYRHIQAIEQLASAYGAQGATLMDEGRNLTALRESLGSYRSALEEVLEMENQHAPVREIDAAVKGVDRPIAAELSRLVEVSSEHPSTWRVPRGPSILLLISAVLSALLLLPRIAVIPALRRRSARSARTLRDLSNRMLEWEDDRKAKAFVRLHDEVCQSLSGIMYFLTSAQHATAGAPGLAPTYVPEAVIPSLQSVIRDARALAFQLRPARMQEAGVLATLRSLWIDGHSVNQRPLIEPCIAVEEQHIPAELKPVILRIAQTTVEFGGQQREIGPIVWSLGHDEHSLTLSIGLRAPNSTPANGGAVQTEAPTRTVSFAEAVRAGVVLSGGESESTQDADGAMTIMNRWSLEDMQRG